MSYDVRVTVAANEELDEILADLSGRSPDSAAKLVRLYTAGLERLRSNPFSCGPTYESRHFNEELRHLLIRQAPRRKYRALFVIRGEEVVILAFRAPGQRPVDPDYLARL